MKEWEKGESLNSVNKHHLNSWAKHVQDSASEGIKGIKSWTEIWDFWPHASDTQQTNMAKPEKDELRSESPPKGKAQCIV